MSAMRWLRFWWHLYIACRHCCDEHHCGNGYDLYWSARGQPRTTGKAGSR